MDELTNLLERAAPMAFDHLDFLKLMGIFCAICLAVSLVGRLVLGRRSGLNRTLSCAIGMVFLYVLGAVAYSLRPQFHFLLTSLPFIEVPGDYVVIQAMEWSAYTSYAGQFLRVVILAFLVNLLDSWFPEGKSILSWYLLRFATVATALVLQYAVFWLFDTYLPEVFVTYAPAILVVLLLSSMVIGALKLLVGLFLATVNPLIAGLYAFFFVNKTGKLLSRSVFTALLLSIAVYALNALGYTMISITASALLAFLPAVAALLVLWYVVRKLL